MENIIEIHGQELKNGTITVQEFVNSVKYCEVFYTTPLGQGLDGKQKLFLLTDPIGQDAFFPVFTDVEQMKAFYRREGRVEFTLLKGSLGETLKMMDTEEKLKPLGVLIDLSIPIAPGVRPN